MWKTEYAVGNLLLDGEHKQILDLLDAYIEDKLPPQENNWDFLRKILLDHVTLHFTHEETLMDLYVYEKEAKQKHVVEHQEIKKTVFAYQNEIQNKEIAKELRTLIENHISTLDKELTSFFKQQETTNPWLNP